MAARTSRTHALVCGADGNIGFDIQACDSLPLLPKQATLQSRVFSMADVEALLREAVAAGWCATPVMSLR